MLQLYPLMGGGESKALVRASEDPRDQQLLEVSVSLQILAEDFSGSEWCLAAWVVGRVSMSCLHYWNGLL